MVPVGSSVMLELVSRCTQLSRDYIPRHLSAEYMLKSAVTEDKKLKNILNLNDQGQ